MASRRRVRSSSTGGPGRPGKRGPPVAPAAPEVTVVWPGPTDRMTLYEMSFDNETIRIVHHWYVADAPARYAARHEDDE